MLKTFGVTCWKEQAVFYKPKCPLVLLKEIIISFSRTFSSKHNVAPLYWSLPPSVLCQWVGQIMLLRSYSLISLLFSLVKEYGSKMNLEILILHFENKNYFDVSLKQFTSEILHTPWLFSFFGKKIICSCVWQWGLRWKYVMRWPFVLKWRAREKARGFVWEKLVSFWTFIFISINNNE